MFLFCDIDGVLIPFPAADGAIPATHHPDHVVPAGEDQPVRIWLNPAHGPLLADLVAATGLEPVWSTSWRGDASRLIGYRLGLPFWPHVDLPLRAGHRADPLREVFGHGLYLGAGDLAMVQVAARPTSSSRLARARADARAGAASVAARVARGLVLGVLDVVTELIRPGPPAGRSPYERPGWERGDPFGQAWQRSAVGGRQASPPVPGWRTGMC